MENQVASSLVVERAGDEDCAEAVCKVLDVSMWETHRPGPKVDGDGGKGVGVPASDDVQDRVHACNRRLDLVVKLVQVGGPGMEGL